MSRIEEMIRDLCPEGVKRMTLGEVCLNCYAGGTPSTSIKDYWENGTIPWMSSGEVNLGQVYDVEKRITQLGYNNSSTKMVPANSVVIALAGQGKTRGLVAITRIELCTNQSLCALIPNTDILSAEYLYMYLQTQYLKLREVSSGDGTRGGLNLKMIKAYPIPVPPLPVQEKITKFFEKFSLLSAELEAELEGRRKQYDFYRNRLLSFDSDTLSELNEGRRQDEASASIVAPSILHQRSINASSKVEWKKLGEMVKIKNGKDYKHLASGNVPVYGTGGVMTYVDQFVYDKPTVLLPRKGSIEKVYFVNTPFWNVDTVYYTEIDETKVLPKYLYYCFTNINLASYNTATGAIPSLTQAVLNNIQFPIPPLAEQEQIVRILDKFEALVTDLSAGLPAEIERVQKQYEYYRNKLFTFPEA